MSMRPYVTYTPYAISSKEQTGNIIRFAQFEEGDLLSDTREYAESGDKSDDDSIMLPLLCKDKMDAMDSGDESDDKPMHKDMLEYICERSQYHPNVDRRKVRYKIRDDINQRLS